MVSQSLFASLGTGTKSLLAFLLIPLVIVMPASLYITYDSVTHNLQSKAQTYLNRMDDVITQLHEENQQAIENNDDCMTIRESMLDASPLRELILLSDDMAVCSSKRGMVISNISPILDQQAQAQSSIFFYDNNDDPHQRTLVVMDHSPKGTGALAVVDKNYLIDRLGPIASDQVSYVTFKLGDKTFPKENPYHEATFSQLEHSERYNYSVLLNANSNYVFRRASYAAFFCILVSLMISFALLIANHRYHQRHSLAYDLRKGIQRRELFVMYQPIVNSDNNEIEGIEALVRWKHPDMNLVRPDIFVPLAEQQNLVNKITDLVLEESLQNLKQIDRTALSAQPALHLGVNVAPQYLHHPNNIDKLVEYANAFETLGFTLTVEITERQVLDHTGRETLKVLRNHGVAIAIDDFGTGHTSLSVIQQTQFDYLKIDKCFIDSIGLDTVNTPVLNTIVDLGHRLGVKIIAEGVEQNLQAEYLKQVNVPLLQGYLFSHPIDISTLKHLLSVEPNPA
ncbi:EAL domain-containing protein [Vibrio olivae]|uniref:cyclic-guanylate-specific phosphodiesterase n=1 Tax=Vibrio olivae TaxID=1243002 RepID=A0ABV5HJQ9_9VIBR